MVNGELNQYLTKKNLNLRSFENR